MPIKYKSKQFKIFPSEKSRAFHIKRNQIYTQDRFEKYNDWFYFIHLDPATRWIHAIGMIIGSFLYLISAYQVWIFGISFSVFILILTAMFFFFFLPLISHYIYDGGEAKSTPDKFISTFIPVVHINLMTLTGTFDSWLARFIEKYPFTVEAWDLVEVRDSEPLSL